ncbi:MAG: transketolase [Lactobacillales bacterium]|jgi:transketolase|nr:transketolase [Lactobacillales bacterium]
MQQDMANALRFLSVDMVEKAKSGHPGMPLGMADVATVLWTKFLKFDATAPDWFDRDRFVLSNGHGSALLYSLLHVTGFKEMTIDQLKSFRQFGSKTPGHPESEITPGVDFSTGPLGQGLTGAVGMALAERMMNARYGDNLVNHKTYVFVGDGDLMEGISEEAISLAGHLGLNKLIVLWDNNSITIDGSTALATSTDMHKRFEANGWVVFACNGQNAVEIEKVLEKAQQAGKPVFIDCKTVIGYGAPTKAGSSKTHGSPLGEEEIRGLRKALKWSYPPFEVPEEIMQKWREVGLKNQGKRLTWEDRLAHSYDGKQFKAELKKQLPFNFVATMRDFKEKLIDEMPVLSTRKLSQRVLEVLVPMLPNLVGGSADLGESVFTKVSDSADITKGNYGGNYINYGIREHAMGGVMNGLAQHGGMIPYGGTFFVFSDYMKPAIRLASIMKLQVIYQFSHDSIGVGEDGPTHQPIEQLAALRAMPNINVFRPADGIETAEAYELALSDKKTPSALVLSRQNLPALRRDASINQTAFGAYVLLEADRKRDITLLATGSEVSLAVKARALLAKQKIDAAVVSMPCWRLFDRQPDDYRRQVLGSAPRLSIEMASPFGWHRYVGADDGILSLNTYGASAPGGILMAEFGFTPEDIVRVAQKILKKK